MWGVIKSIIIYKKCQIFNYTLHEVAILSATAESFGF